MSPLFEPLTLRQVRVRNRAGMSPMCQYGAIDGVASDWHYVHSVSRAAGGAGLVMVQASAVSPEGRISAGDMGLWNTEQAAALRRITSRVKSHGAVAGIQLAHAGRKASPQIPWLGGTPLSVADGGWAAVAPNALGFAAEHPVPMALAAVHLDILVDHFVQSTRLAPRAGFEVLELHMAHSYLLPAFLSPLANLRSDDYGGSLDKRTAFSLRAAQAVREARPAELRLLVRVSCTDWVEGGWDLPSTIEFASQLKQLRADLVDCSSAGTAPDERIPIGPGFQTPVAAAMPGHAGMPSAAGGLITTAEQAEHVLHAGQADVVSLGRAPLRDPYWPLHAAAGLRANVDAWSPRYQRARPS